LESLDGILSRIVFHKPSKWSRTGSKYLIGRLHSGVTVKGEMDDPREGENYRFYGEMRDQKGYDDPAFEFETFEVVIDQTTSGVVQYLKSYVSGLGIVKAQAIVDSFGDETFHVLRTDPERTLNVHGITSKIVDSIREHFKELERRKRFDPVAYAKLIDLFAGHRVPKNVIKDLVNLYSSDAPKKVIGNPYLLLSFPRMGWKTVDSFALSVVKFDPEGLERHAAAIMESFLRLAGDGHTHAPKLTVDSEAFNLLGSVPKGSAWTLLISDGDVMCWPEDPATKSPATFAMTKYASAEKEIAERLLILTKSVLFVRCPIGIDGLKPAQVDAVRLIEEHGVCLLCGAPGTGKSHTIARFIDELVSPRISSGS
jgi:exodeoxyribonuclease V alpha subunit